MTAIYGTIDAILPFGGHLKEDNRWVVLRRMIDWDMIDEEYSRNFENKKAGQEEAPNDKHDDNDGSDIDDNTGGGVSGGGDIPNSSQKTDELLSRGTLILDSTCTPADRAFPTDLEL